MQIVNTPPPNYEEIRKHFPEADYNKGVLFTYGDTCYCKSITPDLVVHEETHVKQQGDNPKEWWARYFVDVDFRLAQELEAYQNQWKWIENNIKDRNAKFKTLHNIASTLSGKLYGNFIPYYEVIKRIKNIHESISTTSNNKE